AAREETLGEFRRRVDERNAQQGIRRDELHAAGVHRDQGWTRDDPQHRGRRGILMYERGTLVRRTIACITLAALLVGYGCGRSAGNKPAAPPCDQKCADGNAIRAYREMLKLMYNVTLQGKPVGPQDQTAPCPLGGTARVFGNATSNALQGAT